MVILILKDIMFNNSLSLLKNKNLPNLDSHETNFSKLDPFDPDRILFMIRFKNV